MGLRTTLLICVLCVLAPCPGRSGDQPGADSLRERLAASAKSLGLQTELPGDEEAARYRRDSSRTTRDQSWRGGRYGSGGGAARGSVPVMPVDAAEYMLYGAMAFLLVVAVLTILDNMRAAGPNDMAGRRARLKTAPVEVVARMESAQGEADYLAGDGRLAEAMHILLLQSLAEMRLRLDIPIAIALTSREILDSIVMDREAHEALAHIIERVEVSYFGDHQPDYAEYSACRASYAALIDILQHGSAA